MDGRVGCLGEGFTFCFVVLKTASRAGKRYENFQHKQPLHRRHRSSPGKRIHSYKPTRAHPRHLFTNWF